VVTGDHILDYTGKNVTDMRLTVSGGRAVIECVGIILGSLREALLEDLVFLPEIKSSLFARDKIKVGRNLVKHNVSPYGI
jgi:hypothetical protein